MSALRSRWTVATVIVTILALGLGSAQAGPGAWPAARGEVCLQNTTTGGLARLLVVRLLGTHYSLQGFVIDGDEQITLVSGNAELAGGQVLGHLTGSGYEGAEVHGLIGSLELDASTLGGVFRGVGFHCDPSDCGIEYEGVQTLVSAVCPE